VLRAPALAAAAPPTFTVSVRSAFLRGAPSLSALRVYSVFQGQVFSISGRCGGDGWLRLEVGGALGAAWVPASYGAVQGSLALVPVVPLPAEPTAAPPQAQATGSANPPPSAAAGAPVAWFTLGAKSAYGRDWPSLTAARVASLFKDQTFSVRGRLPDSTWLRIDFPGVPVVWVPASYGAVAGSLGRVPVETPAPISPPGLTPAPPVTSPPAVAGAIHLGSRARDIYQFGLTLGNNPRVFTRVGDCNSVPPDFLGAFDNPQAYRLAGPFAALQEVVDHFAGSFSRDSQAAAAGFSAAAILDPAWANLRLCQPGETPLACEYRLARPSFALIGVGTNSTWQREADYELGLRAIIQFSLDRGVVPILSTKADNLEGDDRLNTVVIRLAAEYDLPLWDFALAARRLPDHGLGGDRYHLTWGPPVFDDPQRLTFGWQVRNLGALQALDAVWRAVR
jgi:hypothetical protein